MILNIDREKGKIALGLKQKTPSPWENVEESTRSTAALTAQVVNVMSYGAFVKLEEGIEGLVHISEMSWTKRISHPSELVQIGDEIEVVVLGIDKKKQEISLGMKQTQDNPWDQVAERYPIDSMVKGKVRNLTNYGAFVESKRASTACCTSPTCPGPAKSAIPVRCWKKARKSNARCSRSIKNDAGSPWA